MIHSKSLSRLLLLLKGAASTIYDNLVVGPRNTESDFLLLSSERLPQPLVVLRYSKQEACNSGIRKTNT